MLTVEHQKELTTYNTFGIKSYASAFVELQNIEQVIFLVKNILSKYDRHLVLGGGSNVLFRDNFDGLVAHVDLKGIEVLQEDTQKCRLRVMAGEDWPEFVDYCVERGWGGLENLALIPGQVGASPVQNIGAYGREVKDVIEHVEAVDLKTGEQTKFSATQCKFGYRESVFKNELRNRYIITAVVFSLHKEEVFYLDYGSIRDELEKQNVSEITFKAVAEAVKRIRRSKLPDVTETGSAGSFFKNPVVGKDEFNHLKEKYLEMPFFKVGAQYKIPAGWLIDQCGWKGYRKGNAGVYPKQALVLVNYGGASGEDIFGLSEQIRHDVKRTFGIDLEREVTAVEGG